MTFHEEGIAMTTKIPLVTSENFSDLLVQSATEALAHARGEREAARETTRVQPNEPSEAKSPGVAARAGLAGGGESGTRRCGG